MEIELPWINLDIDAASLAPGQRVLVKGRTGRTVVVVRAYDGTFSCLDHHCFHAGGALGSGELIQIEDIGTVLECPAHGMPPLRSTFLYCVDSTQLTASLPR